MAEQFWRLAGGPPPFPRDVASAAAWVLPLLVSELPGLTVARVGAWLTARGVPVPGLPDRPLRACLVARAGGGVILLDAFDTPDERRYSAAHEVAHFLRDHLEARERAARSLGEAALEVFDGRRPATADERVDALLAGARLRPVTHLLGRDTAGCSASAATAEAEAAADRLALELLAPRDEAERRLDACRGRLPEAAAQFARDFGLPAAVAEAYARRLTVRRDAARPLRERLGLPARAEKSENRRRTSDVRPERHI
jgi:Zn-dependent peptidase ImmA (M78 family)